MWILNPVHFLSKSQGSWDNYIYIYKIPENNKNQSWQIFVFHNIRIVIAVHILPSSYLMQVTDVIVLESG